MFDKKLFFFTFIFCGLLWSSCHPLALFKPPLPQTIHAQEGSRKVAVAIDSYGIPFIKASEFEDAIYALGSCTHAIASFSLIL